MAGLPVRSMRHSPNGETPRATPAAPRRAFFHIGETLSAGPTKPEGSRNRFRSAVRAVGALRARSSPPAALRGAASQGGVNGRAPKLGPLPGCGRRPRRRASPRGMRSDGRTRRKDRTTRDSRRRLASSGMRTAMDRCGPGPACQQFAGGGPAAPGLTASEAVGSGVPAFGSGYRGAPIIAEAPVTPPRRCACAPSARHPHPAPRLRKPRSRRRRRP